MAPTLYYTGGGVVYRMVPGGGNDVSMASDFDSSASVLAASGTTLYYQGSGGVVYRMVPGGGNDVSMAGDFDRSVSELTAQ
jgi:hypothetical protein